MEIRRRKWLYAIILPVVLVVMCLLHPPVFYLNDDVTMRSILSGAYTGTPDGHAVYMQYPLTGVLALLYKTVDFIPWLEVLFTACMAICMVLLADQLKQPVIGFLAAFALFVPFCLYMHYTLVAASVAGTAIFLLAMGRRNGWPVILLLLAYMIRGQIGLLCLPFAAAAVVWRVIVLPKQEWKKESIHWFKYGAVLLGGILLCAVMNHLCYSSAEWKNYLSYNDSRTLLYDYTDFLSEDTYATSFASYGMTAEEYQILYSYNTMLDADIDAAKMREVAEAVSEGMQQVNGFAERLKDCILKYYTQIRYNDAPYNYIWVTAYLLLAVGFIFFKKWWQLLVLGILALGRSSIWMYLIWRGRFPERVSLSLYVIELMLLLGMGIWSARNITFPKESVRNICIVGVILCLAILCCYQWQDTTSKVKERAAIQREWDMLKDYCKESSERLYLIDVFSTVEYSGMQYERDTENMMLMGGWMSASPLAEKRFEQLGVQDAAEALYYREDVSLIVEKEADMDWLEDYLRNRFGECELEAVAEIRSRDPKVFVEYRVR